MRPVALPFPWFPDFDGTALDNGAIYIGKALLNPELPANQIPVFADSAGTIPLAQPISTISGFPANAGSPVNIFIDGDYSILVRNKSGSLIYSAESTVDVTESSGSGNAVDDFGAIPDGTGDNSDVFATILASSGQVFLPPGLYNVDELMIIDTDGLDFYGIPGKTIITSNTLTEVAQIVNMLNTRFYGITFQSTAVIGTPSRGVVFGDGPVCYNSTFDRCYYTAPGCKSGGLVILGNGNLSAFSVLNCIAADCGGKGFSIEADIINICDISRNTTFGTGMYTGENGTAIEVLAGGGISNIISNNTVITPTVACMNLEGISDSSIMGNVFSYIPSDCEILTTSDARGRMVNNKYLNNVVAGRANNSGVVLGGHDYPIMQGNTWLISKEFSVVDTKHLKGSGEVIDSTYKNAVIVSGVSENNEWIGGLITNADASPDILDVTVVNTGPDVISTRLVSVELYKEPTLGSLVAGLLTAPVPQIISCSGDAGGGGGSVTTGIKVTTGILAAGVVGGAGCSVQVILDPPSSTIPSPYTVVAYVAAQWLNGPDGSFEQSQKGVKCINDPGASACELIGGGFDATIIPDASGPGFTIFCPYPAGATPGEAVDYVFDISVTGPGTPTFSVVP